MEKFDNRFGWRPIDTAPSDQDVKLVVTDGGDPYLLPHPCRRTMAGWVSFDRLRDGRINHRGVRAGIGRGDGDLGRNDIGILRDRHRQQRQQAGNRQHPRR